MDPRPGPTPPDPRPTTSPAASPSTSPAASAAGNTSVWVTLRHRGFRSLWLASLVYFVANAMQTMAASWLMVELTGSSFLAALVQTAVFLPMFVLSLPAGVLADTTDRPA